MAAAVQIGGNHQFWNRVYTRNALVLDKTLSNQLMGFDTKKGNKIRERRQERESYVAGETTGKVE